MTNCFLLVHAMAFARTPNDQVHRAHGPMGLTFEQPQSVNEGEEVEKPQGERAPVQRLVICRLMIRSESPQLHTP